MVFVLEGLLTVDAGITLLTLTLLEIVLGIDNIVFLAILVGKLPVNKQDEARKIGLALALVARICLLVGVTHLMKLTAPLVTIPLVMVSFTGKDLILLAGGLFLVGKATHEIHEKLEGDDGGDNGDAEDAASSPAKVSEGMIIAQIVAIDVVFSLDSVITAVGIADQLAVMIGAVVIAIGIMMAFAGKVSDFVNNHPSIKMLALSFLILIGVMLVAESFHQAVPKGYVYFAMAFSLMVEVLNMRADSSSAPVLLRSARRLKGQTMDKEGRLVSNRPVEKESIPKFE